MNHIILLKESFKACGLSVRLTNSQNKNSEIIRDLWLRFNNELRLKNIRLGKSWKKYGITFRNMGNYHYMVAIPFKQTYDFSTIKILGGTFVCFQHIGAMNLLKNSYYNIYKKLIPFNNLSIDKNRTILHYEVYDNRFNWNKSDSVIDIIIPLE